MYINLIFYLLIIVITNNAYADVECHIKFPHAKAQGVKIYQGGIILPTENYGNKVCFFVKDMNKEKRFFLLIVNPADIIYNFKQKSKTSVQNTVQHRIVSEGKEYKLYLVTLLKDSWEIEEYELGQDRIIPDSTVILFYNPTYISHVDAQHTVTIYIRDDVISVAGGEDKLFYEEVKYLFDTLHVDPLYQKWTFRISAHERCKQILGI